MRTKEDVINLFSYHQLDADGVTRISYFRERYISLALDIMNGTRESPERTLALRKLHDSMMEINVLISLDYPQVSTGS